MIDLFAVFALFSTSFAPSLASLSDMQRQFFISDSNLVSYLPPHITFKNLGEIIFKTMYSIHTKNKVNRNVIDHATSINIELKPASEYVNFFIIVTTIPCEQYIKNEFRRSLVSLFKSEKLSIKIHKQIIPIILITNLIGIAYEPLTTSINRKQDDKTIPIKVIIRIK